MAIEKRLELNNDDDLKTFEHSYVFHETFPTWPGPEDWVPQDTGTFVWTEAGTAREQSKSHVGARTKVMLVVVDPKRPVPWPRISRDAQIR